MTPTLEGFGQPRVPRIDPDVWAEDVWSEIGNASTDGVRRDGPITAEELEHFGLTYLPDYCQLKLSRLHRELCQEVARVEASPDGERTAIAAPRANAKSTWMSLINPLCKIVRGRKKFIIIISDTSTQANSLLNDIRSELEDNEALARDYPHACGRGPVWRDHFIITRNNVAVLALGSGKRIRGRRHRAARPDEIIIDDLENDENTRNPEQRDKLHDWLNKAVLKAKGVASKCDVWMVGTVMHFDGVLARTMDPQKSPGWRSRKYKAVIRWAARKDLWDEWQALYTDWSKKDEDRLEAAQAFLACNREEMLRGTEVLWPEGEPYEVLMRTRVDEGPTSFDSEKQNEPIDPSSCQFPEEWFQWFVEEQDAGGEWWLRPEKGAPVKLTDCDVFGAVDPSMGKLDKHRDPSAIVAIAAYPSTRIDPNGSTYQSLWVIDASIVRRHPHVIQSNLFDLHRKRRFARVGVESVQFQELFAEHVQAAALEDATIADLVIRKLRPLGDKILRIQRLGPFIYSGRLKFNRALSELYGQLRYFPQAAHDDGPDAVELCLEVMGQIGLVNVEGGPVDRDPKAAAKSPAQQQLEHSIPQAVTPDLAGEACGNCMNWERREGTRGYCRVLRVAAEADLPICEHYDSVEGG